MREILFRGKRIYNGEWVEGYYVLGESDNLSYIIPNNNSYESAKPVIDETIGQFTGLTDKNGVKIFEGDILSRDCYNASGRMVKIVYSVELAEFCAQTPSGGRFSMLPPIGKVIGNIHDNPEIMEDKT